MVEDDLGGGVVGWLRMIWEEGWLGEKRKGFWMIKEE